MEKSPKMFRTKAVVEEDVVNYKKTSFLIANTICIGWKCCPSKDGCGCQNLPLNQSKVLYIYIDKLIERYLKNSLTEAIVFGGLENFDEFEQMYEFIRQLREDFNCDDDVVIQTGYYEHEIEEPLTRLKKFKNIIVKFGRYVEGQKPHYDEVLGVNLANKEQYAKQIS